MIRILYLAANPLGTPPLMLYEESRAIAQALRQSNYHALFEVREHLAVRAADLQELLMNYKADIVHFGGHGTTASEIVLQDAGGQIQAIPVAVLEKLFTILGKGVSCVLLNACYSEPQAMALARHVDCVVGMTSKISDASAIGFATAFYRALGSGRDVQSAFELGCLQISLENRDEQDIPKLLSYRADPASISLASWASSTAHLNQEGNRNQAIDESIDSALALGANQDGRFSRIIREQMSDVNRTIEALTLDQYRIIQWLRGHRRARISGCAGSGKTLVAIEKAVRLDRAGLQTLVLCHNPNLAEYLRRLATGTSVVIYDFVSWVADLLGRNVLEAGPWSNYYEPLPSEITEARETLLKSESRFDAIIVDEAQDFRGEWWELIESALLSRETGVLYLFHDDNQALLPLRAQYPIAQAPFSLSKNCRNAGNIFSVVRHFHDQAPQVSDLLKDKGVVRFSVFEATHERQTVASAVQEALDLFEPDHIAVLTTELTLLDQSVLHGMLIEERLKWRWQEAVNRYLRIMCNVRGGSNNPQDLKMPCLSDSSYPTLQDIQSVSAFASSISAGQKRFIEERMGHRDYRWYARSGGLTLKINGRVDALKLAAFFNEPEWADTIPVPAQYELTSIQNGPRKIGLYDMGVFKGLESDAIVLFVRAPRDDLGAHLYVGLSRARMYLHLVLSEQLHAQFQRNAWFRNLSDVARLSVVAD